MTVMRYGEMKDSGVEWIGLVPKDWIICPAGAFFKEVKTKNTDNKYSNPFSFKYGEIVDKVITGGIDEDVEETLSAYRVVKPNTIMINGLNLNYDFISQRVAIVRNEGIITSAYLAIQPNEKEISPNFAVYLFKAYDHRQVFHGNGSGVRKTLKFSDFKSIPVIVPHYELQERIVCYLDDQCGQIDDIISSTKSVIEEYKQWKASVIFEAVTKGLDPSVPMKDSGVEWIGAVPNDWKITKAKRFMMLMNGDRTSRYPQGAEFLSDGIPFLSAYNLNSDTVDTNNCRFISEDKYNSLAGAKIQINDIIFCLRGAGVGKCAINLTAQKGTIASSLVAIRPINIYSKFLLYILLSDICMSQTLIDSNGSCADNLSADSVANFVIPIPPKQKQNDIANYLDTRCAEIDSIIAEKESLIADLESYKKSLIYETVTGKRKVA